jgi:cystathionine gamma-lyase
MCADNTFMSPYLQNPLTLGADIVIHSVTKYIGGHSDVLMGVVVTNNDELNSRLKYLQNAVGAIPSPFCCYMALRGLKTLHVRMEYAQRNAQTIAEFLEGHAQVEKVIYPGLACHPQHELCKTQTKGFGAMITFFVAGGLLGAQIFLQALQLFTLAESLGAVESLAESPAIMTHASVPAHIRAELGISDNLIRLSIGIEHIDDLLQDLTQALLAVKGGL